MEYIYIYIYRRADSPCPKKLQFAAYGQFVNKCYLTNNYIVCPGF